MSNKMLFFTMLCRQVFTTKACSTDGTRRPTKGNETIGDNNEKHAW